MNTTPMLTQLLAQLAVQSPILAIYIVGIVLAAMRWRRAPNAMMLAAIGLGLLLLTSVGVTFVQNFIIQNRTGAVGATSSLAQTMMIVAIAGSILRAAGMALVVAAVFAGRSRDRLREGFEVPMATAAPGR